MSPPGDVLVVDDDPDMVDVIELVLRTEGYAVRSAENGKRALEAVATAMPALVLLDMLMPVMDGWQFARELRARYGRVVPIVVVTAAEHAQSRAAEIGADDVVSKPFDVDDLLQIVARHAPAPAASHPAPERGSPGPRDG
jgi:two-component system, chemotaxis family, chemotaxis protein CheY